MNKEIRIRRIQEIINRDINKPHGIMEITWQDSLKSMNVYKVPLEYLVYNKYNTRILSRTKSLEKQKHNIDVESKEGKKEIEDLLYQSNEIRNKITSQDINKKGQRNYGIITKDGIIIDGNRRVMILNRGNQFTYFKTVILDVTLDEDPLEIKKLETTYQMGEDEKLGYNATEKYLSAQDLYYRLAQKRYSSNPKKHDIDVKAIKKIADWMSENPPEIIKYLNIMEVMDDYLEYFEYDGYYTQLDKREDLFIFLTKWLNNYYDKESDKGFDGYRNGDVDELKNISFDYIRARYEGKEFRVIADGQKENHFFGDKDVWKSFVKNHNANMKNIQESKIDINSKNLNKHLDDRDARFEENTKFGEDKSFLEENIYTHKEMLHINRATIKPNQLVDRSFDAINKIKTGHKSLTPDVMKKIVEISNVAISILHKSPSSILSNAIRLLEEIKINRIPDSEMQDVKDKLKEIQKLGYNISKSL